MLQISRQQKSSKNKTKSGKFYSERSTESELIEFTHKNL